MSDDAVNPVLEQYAEHGRRRKIEELRKCSDRDEKRCRRKGAAKNINVKESEVGVSSGVKRAMSELE